MGRTELDAHVVDRVLLTEHEGKSGAPLERILLDDGTRVVVKRFSAETDLVMSLTGDTVGREYQLWRSGLLDDLPAGIGHAVLDGWTGPDGTVLVMRDLGDAVLTWQRRLTREQCRWVFARLARMYTAFAGRTVPCLTPLPALLGLFAPRGLAPHVADDNPLAGIALRGWEIFAELVPEDVAEPVLSLLEDPTPLAAALVSRPCTIVHGDLATVNMAFEEDRLTLLDWSMPASAPAALDLGRFLAGCASVVDATREELIDDFTEALGDGRDGPSLRLGLLSSLVWLGWNKALDAAEHPDPVTRARERNDLDWWVGQSRTTLETTQIG